MSVDPGVAGTGISIWKESLWCVRPALPVKILNLYADASAGKEFVDRTQSILGKIEGLVKVYEIDEVWCERPEYFDSVGGNMVAKSGDLAKLLLFSGAIMGFCMAKGIGIHMVTPNTWKGQRSKDKIQRLLMHILPDLECKSHSFDACGIGLFAQGFLTRNAI